MIRSATPVVQPPQYLRPPRLRSEPRDESPESRSLYDRAFWMAYVSYALVTTAWALLYRYADFVAFLGGTEFHLGWIVGVGMSGSIVMRLASGSSIDRFGSRIIWLAGTGAFVIACFVHLAIASYSGAAIYAARILLCSAVAISYGAGLTFITSRGPVERMAEMTGMLGTAGFLGVILGPMLGDVLFGSGAVTGDSVAKMFIAAGTCALLSLPFVLAATRGETPPKHEPGPPMWQIVRRHRSGSVLLMATFMGIGLGLPATFLRTYAVELEIPRVSVFFTVFAVAAIITRVVTRRWFERFGTQWMIALGIAGLAVSQLLFLGVRAEWQLVFPAIGYGASQAIVIPAIIAATAVRFPLQHRGLAMVLALAASDFGMFIGAPLIGALLEYSALAGLPPYPTMYLSVASLLGAAAAWYAVSVRRNHHRS